VINEGTYGALEAIICPTARTNNEGKNNPGYLLRDGTEREETDSHNYTAIGNNVDGDGIDVVVEALGGGG